MAVRWLCVLVFLALMANSAQAEPWYVPMGEQVEGGFNHIQAKLDYASYVQFDTPAISLFWACEAPDDIDLLASQWTQLYRNPVFVSAAGPAIDNYLLAFDFWISGQPPLGTVMGTRELGFSPLQRLPCPEAATSVWKVLDL